MVFNIKHLQGLLEADLPPSEYVLINSVWLTLMGLRINGDLDLLISSRLWRERFNDKPVDMSFGIPGEYERRLRVHALKGGPYGKLAGVVDNDDAVYNHRVEFNGLQLIEPVLYFRYKVVRLARTEKMISELPWWRRSRMSGKTSRKLFHKSEKDHHDFELIRRFFYEDKHHEELFSKLSETQWGLDDPELCSFITK